MVKTLCCDCRGRGFDPRLGNSSCCQWRRGSALEYILIGCMHAKLLQSCPTLCDPMDCGPPHSCPWNSPGKNAGVGPHVPSRGTSPPRGRACASFLSPSLAGGFCTTYLLLLDCPGFECCSGGSLGEVSGTPLQYSCLENPMDGGAWKAAVRGVAEGRTRLSNVTFMHWRKK